MSDLDSELVGRQAGPARVFMRAHGRAEIAVSVVTLAEFYEKRGLAMARELAARFTVLGIHQADAFRCGLIQTRLAHRRLEENDAWLAAQALRSDAGLVTRDGRFADVPGLKVVAYA